MAKSKDGVNKSEEVRTLLGASPNMETKEVVATLASQGITVKPGLVYLIKGKLKAARRRQTKDKVAKVVASNGDPVALIHKVKSLANEVGGLKKLKSLVEVMSN